MSRRLRDFVLLAGLAGASALFVAVILSGGEPALREPPEAPATGQDAAADSFALAKLQPVPLEALAGARERPLFSRARRPPTAPAAAPSRLEATLAGVLTDGTEKLAIVLATDADRPARLREGDLFQGWRVTRIDDVSVLLERDGRTERLELSFRAAPN